MTWCHPPPPPPAPSITPPVPPSSLPFLPTLEDLYNLPTTKTGTMEDYDVRSAASILASVKEQEARFEQLTRALEEERRNVTLQLERANLPPSNQPTSQPLAWQQVVMQVTPCQHVCMLARPGVRVSPLLLPFSAPQNGRHCPASFRSFRPSCFSCIQPSLLITASAASDYRRLIHPLDFWDTHPLCLLPPLAAVPSAPVVVTHL